MFKTFLIIILTVFCSSCQGYVIDYSHSAPLAERPYKDFAIRPLQDSHDVESTHMVLVFDLVDGPKGEFVANSLVYFLISSCENKENLIDAPFYVYQDREFEADMDVLMTNKSLALILSGSQLSRIEKKASGRDICVQMIRREGFSPVVRSNVLKIAIR